jgi:hypothetical protein
MRRPHAIHKFKSNKVHCGKEGEFFFCQIDSANDAKLHDCSGMGSLRASAQSKISYFKILDVQG